MMTTELLDRLISVVNSYYDNEEGPLLLSRLGQLNGVPRDELVKEYKRLGKAVEATGGKLRITNPLGKPGTDIVVLAQRLEEIEDKVKAKDASLAAVDRALETVPSSAMIAFCLRKEDDQRIALQTRPPYRYKILGRGEDVPSSMQLIDDHFRSVGIYWPEATRQEKHRVWIKFREWATHHGLDPDQFLSYRGSSGSDDGVSVGSNALERLIEAQDPEITGRILIPADIAHLLMNHK